MPARSKFTSERRVRIIELLSAGASRRQAAAAVGIHPAQLTRWLQRGSKAAPGGRWRTFAAAVAVAEGSPPTLVELSAEHDRMLGDPLLAWRFLERTEPGFARPDSPEPIVVEVVHSPTISKGDSA